MAAENRTLLRPGASGYPAVLRRCSGGGDPAVVTTRGSLDALDGTLIGFFCSVRCPGDIVLKTYGLARALRNAEVALIGGFQSPMEKEFLGLLLRGSAAAVVCPARGLGNMRIPGNWKNPLAEGRLLLLSFFGDNIRRPTATTAARRNACVAALADRILVAHAEPGGKTEMLCRDALAQGKPVFTLGSPDNAHFIEVGAIPIPANEPAPLIADSFDHAG